MELDKLQQFLSWIYQIACSAKCVYNSTAVRAFYLTLNLTLLNTLFRTSDFNFAQFLALNLYLACVLARDLNLNLEFAHTLAQDLDLNLVHSLDSALGSQLDQARAADYFAAPQSNIIRKLWKKGCQWMIKHFNNKYNWQFSEEQKILLQDYYYLNKQLIGLLRGDCEVSPVVRQEILDTLLLPVAEIERRKRKRGE